MLYCEVTIYLWSRIVWHLASLLLHLRVIHCYYSISDSAMTLIIHPACTSQPQCHFHATPLRDTRVTLSTFSLHFFSVLWMSYSVFPEICVHLAVSSLQPALASISMTNAAHGLKRPETGHIYATSGIASLHGLDGDRRILLRPYASDSVILWLGYFIPKHSKCPFKAVAIVFAFISFPRNDSVRHFKMRDFKMKDDWFSLHIRLSQTCSFRAPSIAPLPMHWTELNSTIRQLFNVVYSTYWKRHKK